MKLSLVVLDGQAKGKEIPIGLSQFLIGRDPQCHLRPASSLISKRHCAVLVREGKIFLRDFGSTNGTIVNKKPLKGEIELHNGDDFKVGPLEFRVKVEGSTAVDKPTPLTSVSKPAATKAATRPPKTEAGPRSATMDEDSVADMLMDLGDDVSGPGGDKDSVPVDSTVTQMPALTAHPSATTTMEGKSPEEPGPEKPKKPEKTPIPPQASSSAAAAILKKYQSRPRSST